MDKFAAIRSYKDHEVSDVINTLLCDDRVTSSFLQLIFPRAYAFIPFKNFLIRRFLSYKLRSIDNIESYQKIFENLVEKVINQSISSFTCNGLEQLDKNYRYLFISNHRDITLDSALLNYALYKAGHKTFNIAVGDNLMNTKWVADLMRLNKSFIIQRSGATKKDILTQFLMEAVFLSQFGGIVGIIFGVSGGNIVSILFNIPAVIPIDWALIGLIVCSIIGIGFGIYPAWRAAQLDPIESLRFE